MVDVQPFRARVYSDAGSLPDVTAPPYDVVDTRDRADLVARSPYNVVALDLPQDPAGGDRYAHAADLLEQWVRDGVLVQDAAPALWAQTQELTGPDGVRRTRRGVYAAVRLTAYGAGGIRPHERTQPGPKQDRLRLMQATRHDLSSIFGLVDRDVWPLLEPSLAGPPWGEVTDRDGTRHRLWRVEDPEVHEAVTAALADAEVLIADGHHRYETARTYAEEVGGEGPHRFVLMNLVALSDPGLAVFPTHRLLTGLDEADVAALEAGLREVFEVVETDAAGADPAGEPGVGVLGYRSAAGTAWRLRLRGTAAADAALPGTSAAYRALDPALLEALVLRGLLGMTADDIAAKRGLGYARSDADVVEALGSGAAQAVFLLRPTPVEQVRAVAAAGESMPPKSTFFHPKLLTGLLLYPLV